MDHRGKAWEEIKEINEMVKQFDNGNISGDLAMRKVMDILWNFESSIGMLENMEMELKQGIELKGPAYIQEYIDKTGFKPKHITINFFNDPRGIISHVNGDK